MEQERIEQLLENRFDMTAWDNGFVDRFSHMVVSLSRNIVELTTLSPRGLIEWRGAMTESLCRLQLKEVGTDEPAHPVYVQQCKFLPWTAEQVAMYQSGESSAVDVRSRLYSSEFNVYTWRLDFTCIERSPVNYRLLLSGRLLEPQKAHTARSCEKGLICSFKAETKASKYVQYPQIDGLQPTWSLRSDACVGAEIDQETFAYTLDLGELRLAPGESTSIYVQLDFRHVPVEEVSSWLPGKMLGADNPDALIAERKSAWTRSISNAVSDTGDVTRRVRSAAALTRCGYEWGHYTGQQKTIASYCSVTSWASTAFFWDSIMASLGTVQFDKELAKDTLRAIYLRQREDGCIPTHSYEHAVGSTFEPQAPFTAWAIVRMLDWGMDLDFVREMLPKIDRLYEWFVSSQDHDRDGLYEWRFSGSAADNSPIFDAYAAHIQTDFYNVYLPPVASVSLNSYLIMEAKCLAYLYGLVGQPEKIDIYKERAKGLSEKLKAICLDANGVFFDYDHHMGKFNDALTLFSFLPVWAGVEMDDKVKRSLIKNYLLNPKHFYGDYPFPYLAYSEEAYTPQGYWRGRVWPHTTVWMLELLWANGYTKEADEAARRIMEMMGQREEILENYFSNPKTPGGGSPDYNWSMGAYLVLSSRNYRKPVIEVVSKGS